MKLYKDKKWLFHQYFDLKKSCNEIGKEWNCCLNTIYNQIKKFGGKIRSYSEAQKINQNKPEVKKKVSARMKGNKLRWKTGEYQYDGYIFIHKPNHPRANKSGYVRKHFLIIEKMLGRYLTKDEIVHHIDLFHSNNDLENLFVCKNRSEHTTIHYKYGRESKTLYKLGIIKFNKLKREYYLNKEKRKND